MIQLAYAILCVALAADNARVIKSGKVPLHWLNGLLHLTAAFLLGYFKSWWLFPAMLCTARVVFNVALNLFRGESPFYVTPEKRPKSFVDRIEKRIFKADGEAAFWFYFLIWTASNVLYLIFK